MSAPDKPIIFSAESVRAILAGRKTVTRRIVEMHPEFWDSAPRPFRDDPLRLRFERTWIDSLGEERRAYQITWPRYRPGGHVWVKEALEHGPSAPGYRPGIKYSATMTAMPWREGLPPEVHAYCGKALWLARWKADRPKLSPMFCPRWASRIDLEVAAVRAERLQEITSEDAEREGFREIDTMGGQAWARDVFLQAWDHLNPKAPAASNPWVWRIEFRAVEIRGAA